MPLHQKCDTMPQMNNCYSTGTYSKMCAVLEAESNTTPWRVFFGIKKQKAGSYLRSQLHFVRSAYSIPFQVYYYPIQTLMEQAQEQLCDLRGTTTISLLSLTTQDDELFFTP